MVVHAIVSPFDIAILGLIYGLIERFALVIGLDFDEATQQVAARRLRGFQKHPYFQFASVSSFRGRHCGRRRKRFVRAY